MSELSITGTLVFKGEIQTVSQSFEKRVFRIQTDEQYPQTIEIELQQGNTNKIDTNNLGDILVVSFNLRGREWTNPQGEVKCFNTLVAWKIATFTPARPQGQQQPQQNNPPVNNTGQQQGFVPNNNIQSPGFHNTNQFNEEEHDDLPF